MRIEGGRKIVCIFFLMWSFAPSSIETESALLQPLKGSRRGLFWQLQNIPIKSYYFEVVLHV